MGLRRHEMHPLGKAVGPDLGAQRRHLGIASRAARAAHDDEPGSGNGADEQRRRPRAATSAPLRG